MTTDEKILALLYAVGSNAVSGSELARQAGISRDAARHSIETWRQLGYVVEEHPELGYCLSETPDALMASDLQARLNCGVRAIKGQIGNRILVLKETASTNDVVQRLASAGHPGGLVVFAESQIAGRGRQGRVWCSPAHKGLWFTVLLRPRLPMYSAQRLTVMAAAAVVASLGRATGLPLRIRWPNDILCHDRKLAGILVELDADAFDIRHAALGIGINVNLETTDFPPQIRAVATSLKQEAGRCYHRPTLAVEVLREIERCQSLLSDEKFHTLLERWIEWDDTLGRQISVLCNDGRRLRGLASSLDSDGALLVRTDEGCLERVMGGEVTLESIKD